MREDILDYLIIEDIDGGDLASQIKCFMHEGWCPYGDPFVYHAYICQAMVKYKTQDTSHPFFVPVKESANAV